MKLSELKAYLDTELRINDIPDYPNSLNGLQLESSKDEITTVGCAVDANLMTIIKAVKQGVDFLLVHHGLFWAGARPLTGVDFAKIELAIDSKVAIYSAHLPLDVHPVWGNNIMLAKALGLEPDGTFLDYKGQPIGITCKADIMLPDLVTKFEAGVEGSHPNVGTGGPMRVQRVGICTGAAGSHIEDAYKAGVDTFITGEGPHWSFLRAEELGMNAIYGGHYWTETAGVRALAEHLSEKFNLGLEYINHPSGI
jgi:dinuclear metal center YbgI/SA1388 family protein